MNTKQKAFTLIELLVVIAIIAILAISIAVGYQSVRKSARDSKRMEISRSIVTAQEMYFNEHNQYATNLQDLIDEEYLNSHPDDAGVSRSATSNNFLNWRLYNDGQNDYFALGFRNSDETYYCVNPDGINECSSSSNCINDNC